MKLLVNGKVCDEQAAVISVYDHGYMYGMGLFETFRTYGGKPFLLEQHLKRLHKGCQELGILWEPDVRRIEEQVQQLMAVNDLTDAYIRYTVSAGEAALGLPLHDYEHANTVMYMKELPSQEQLALAQKTGKALQRLRIKRNTPEGTSRLKSFHFMNNILAKREMQAYPWSQQAEGLFLTQSGHLAEGVVSNLFFVRDGKLFTPDLETGILAGITREHVMTLASQCGVAIEEGFYRWKDLLQADEVFITNSIQEIMPVIKLFDEEGQAVIVSDGQVGPYTRQFIQAYRASTGG